MSAVITRIEHSKHKEIMIRILHDIYSNKNLKTILWFKWWTALYLFHWLDRFSTDLDFDLLEFDKENLVLDELAKIVWKYWEIKAKTNKRYTLFLLLSYWWIEHNIKIEVSKREKNDKYEIKNLIWINVLTMSLEYLTANKLVALTNRTSLANRDLYDAYFIFKNNLEIEENVIKSRTDLSIKEYFKKCLEFVENIDEKYPILDWLWAVLDNKQKAFVKTKLLDYLKKEFAIRSL